MKKNGFTLIELLAVIVILAIIALIATPAVLNIIEDSRKGAAEASARNITKTGKNYYIQQTMSGRIIVSIDLSTDTLHYSGSKATKGYVIFTNEGYASSKMYINGYCVEVDINNKATSEKMDEDDCDTTLNIESTPVVPISYTDGTALYFNPVTGATCSSSDYTTSKSNTGVNTGCMKWYAFLDSEDSSTVNLILDHNTTGGVAWNSLNGETPDTVNAKLQEDVTNWNATVRSTARLITAEEINKIAPTAEGFTWSQTDPFTDYYLHTGTKDGYYATPKDAGSNAYAWLFDNTSDCTNYGCNRYDYGTKGYWTGSYSTTYDTSGLAWCVAYDGSLDRGGVDYDGNNGVRPVITVSKDVFK